MPTYTQSQDVFKVDAVDPLHINPSIMEGEKLYPSILGPLVAVPIVRFAPYYVINASISGDPAIPSTLICNPGVVAASPQPSFSYQWQSDGVDIDGETNSTLVTDGTLDATTITCDVEAVNFLGVASSTSNGIYVQIIEPVRMEEHTFAAITGLNQENQHNLNLFYGAVVIGLSNDDTQLVFELDNNVIDGLPVDDQLTSFNLDVYTVELIET